MPELIQVDEVLASRRAIWKRMKPRQEVEALDFSRGHHGVPCASGLAALTAQAAL